MTTRPTAFSKWTHREQGGEYTFLTVAKGTGADHGVDFAYYIGTGPDARGLQALVRRLDDWAEVMVPVEGAEADAGEADDMEDFLS